MSAGWLPTVTAIGSRSPRSRAARAADREMVIGGDADQRARAAERPHARDRPVALAGLGIARDDAAGGDVRPALVLEEARDRQQREVGIVLDDLLARRRVDDGRRRAARPGPRAGARRGSASPTPSASAISARVGMQVGDQRQLAAVDVRDAHGLAVVRDEPCGQPGGGVECLADLDQPAAGRELREPRPQRLGVRRRHRARPSARARRPRCGRGRSSRPRPRRRSARAPARCARAVPRPSGEQPRTSTACAATTRPSASSSSATATSSLRRRAASGAIVMRSSMPSASSVEAVSVESGMRERARLDHERLAGPGELRERALVALGLGLLQPGAEAGERRLQQLDRALLRARDRRHERDAGEIERGGERQRLVVRNRDDDRLADRHERVLVRGVELDRELRAGEAEAVVDGAQDARGVAERERVLQVARRPRLPQVRARRAARASARCGARCRDTAAPAATAGCRGEVLAAKASQSSAAATVKASSRRTASASASAARPVPKELLLISEMPSLAARGMSPQMPKARSASGPRSLWPAEPSMRTRGVSSALSASTTRASELGPHARGALREPVREPHHGRAHDLARRVRAGAMR